MKYEYKVTRYPGPYDNNFCDTLQKELNEMEEEGWTFVTCSTTAKHGRLGVTYEHFWIYRRNLKVSR